MYLPFRIRMFHLQCIARSHQGKGNRMTTRVKEKTLAPSEPEFGQPLVIQDCFLGFWWQSIYIGMSSSLRKLCPLKTTPCLSYPQSSLPQSFSAAVVSSGFRGNVQLWSAFSCFVRANLDRVRLIQHVGNRREDSLRQIKKLSSFSICINLLVKAKIYRSSKLITLTSHGAE